MASISPQETSIGPSLERCWSIVRSLSNLPRSVTLSMHVQGSHWLTYRPHLPKIFRCFLQSFQANSGHFLKLGNSAYFSFTTVESHGDLDSESLTASSNLKIIKKCPFYTVFLSHLSAEQFFLLFLTCVFYISSSLSVDVKWYFNIRKRWH
jgi:hypothetical protein